MPESQKVRLDKFLWAVRIYKTRSLSTAACTDGKIKMDGHPVKASKQVRTGEIYEIRKESDKLIIRVEMLLEKRVGAGIVKEFITDLSPPRELKAEAAFYVPGASKLKGRPTKKLRRQIDRFTGN